MDPINSDNINSCLFKFYSISTLYSLYLPDISSIKRFFADILPKWKTNELKTKELKKDWSSTRKNSETCPGPGSNRAIGHPHLIHENKHKSMIISRYKNEDKAETEQNLNSPFMAAVEKERSQLYKSRTQAEWRKHLFTDTYLNSKPAEGNLGTIGMQSEKPFSNTLILISVAQITLLLILIFWPYYCLSEMRSLKKSMSEVKVKAQAMDNSTAEKVFNGQKHPENDEDIKTISSTAEKVSNHQKYPESDEEVGPISNNDELALMTVSSMVYCHLQNLASEIQLSKSEEKEKYLTEDFLQLIAARIAQDDCMKLNFQKLLPAEKLLQLGQFHYYQRNRNSGETR